LWPSIARFSRFERLTFSKARLCPGDGYWRGDRVVTKRVEHCTRIGTTFGEAKEAISRLGAYVQAKAVAVDGEDKSFFIVSEGEVVGIMPVFVVNGTACLHDGTSIIPHYCNEQSKACVNEAICEWVIDALRHGEARSIKILPDNSLLAALLGRPELVVSDNTRIYGYVDLSLQSATLWQSIRKSYRSLIRKGELRFDRTAYSGKDSVDPAVIDFLVASPHTQFRYDLGRVRDHIAKMANNEATLLAYWLESRMVGVVGIVAWDKFAAIGDHFYELGAYDHYCGIPTHFCLYDALSYYQSNRLGNRVYLLHGVPTERPENQSKLRNIDFYKQGYCSDTFTRPYKVVTLAG
jgi:hypothetical protein